MKKINLWLFAPAIVYLLFFVYACFANGRISLDIAFVFNIAWMFAAGVLMQNNIVFGGVMGIALGLFWSALDLFRNGLFVPRHVVCIPLIFYYWCCAVYLKDKK